MAPYRVPSGEVLAMNTGRIRLKNHTFMAVAQQIAELGTCDRKKVGAVIVKHGRCISWGFNGAPEGLPHCDENNHGMEAPPPDARLTKVGLEAWYNGQGCRNATHAEANALAFAARQGISTEGATLFVTVSPCETCARLLIAAGIRHVYYREEYRDRSGIELLNRSATALLLSSDGGGDSR